MEEDMGTDIVVLIGLVNDDVFVSICGGWRRNNDEKTRVSALRRHLSASTVLKTLKIAASLYVHYTSVWVLTNPTCSRLSRSIGSENIPFFKHTHTHHISPQAKTHAVLDHMMMCTSPSSTFTQPEQDSYFFDGTIYFPRSCDLCENIMARR